MTRKCIGIISYFPKNLEHRKIRKERFNKLIQTLDAYFKLPIVIIAQNWDDEDIPIIYNNKIIIYRYKNGLGITKARITLREKLLSFNYDYYIFLDDDSDIVCTKEGVINYLAEIDNHPGMVGRFNSDWPRLLAISNQMLKIMDFDFIKDKEAYRGEIWEDSAYLITYRRLYPNKFFIFSKRDIKEISPVARKDTYSTWYRKEFGEEKQLRLNTKAIIEKWVRHKKGR